MNKIIFILMTMMLSLTGCVTTDNTEQSFANTDEIKPYTQYQKINADDASVVIKTLNDVNFKVNQQISYEYDIDQYGIDDYWASPDEVLRTGRGDCEDYAFLKRDILIKMGIPQDRLKLIHVDVQESGTFASRNVEQHIVLAYYRNAESNNPLILDNMKMRVMFLRSRKDFSLNYIFDEQHVWETSGNTIDKQVHNTDILPKFAELRVRSYSE